MLRLPLDAMPLAWRPETDGERLERRIRLRQTDRLLHLVEEFNLRCAARRGSGWGLHGSPFHNPDLVPDRLWAMCVAAGMAASARNGSDVHKALLDAQRAHMRKPMVTAADEADAEWSRTLLRMGWAVSH